jgi:Trk-type K+ transport system membrane component
MNYRMIFNILGRTLLAEAALLLLPLLVCVIYGESVWGFVITILIALIMAFSFLLIRPKSKTIFAREGFVIVALTWVVLSIVGSLPFMFYGYTNLISYALYHHNQTRYLEAAARRASTRANEHQKQQYPLCEHMPLREVRICNTCA